MTVLDTNRPNPARVFNALAGGKDYYELDRVIAEPLLGSQLAVALAEARRFARRAVEYLSTTHQVHQVVELGCGLPQWPDIGEVAVHANPKARTLYLDHDIVVTTHARALLTEQNGVVAEVDITDIDAVLARIGVVMDSAAPLAICLSGTAELLADGTAVFEALTRKLPRETWVVFSHITNEVAWSDIGRAAEALGRAGIAFCPRDRDTISTMLAPYRLTDPGLIAAHRWRPLDTEHDALQAQHPYVWDLPALAAVGQLPG
ncbi:SAM-dependent methyltransferase [Nocardia mangyaensis]|uniref:SAM-dependent methyltransferase n=1 Tax=Nocardia mangyaensis TaxID=2213200 RepID=UPI00267750D7|nr:SAM-dependent methyltransferase [Nocardia mangyaensis]MDO3646147.1 SAM-dependent methyltransferase [Nocardia mangyaensis]